jgi:hypothetical protein
MPEESTTEQEALSRSKANQHAIEGFLLQFAVLLGISWLLSRFVRQPVLNLLADVVLALNLGIGAKRFKEGKEAMEKIGNQIARTRHRAVDRLYLWRVHCASFLYSRRVDKRGELAELSRAQRLLLLQKNADAVIHDRIAWFEPRWARKIRNMPPQAQYNLLGHWWGKHRDIVSSRQLADSKQRQDLVSYNKVPERLEQLRLAVKEATADMGKATRDLEGLAQISGFGIAKAEKAHSEAEDRLKRRKDNLDALRPEFSEAAKLPETRKETQRYFADVIKGNELSVATDAVAASYEALKNVTRWMIESSGDKIGLELQKALLTAVKEADASRVRHDMSRDSDQGQNQFRVAHSETGQARQRPLDTQQSSPAGSKDPEITAEEISVEDKIRELVAWAGLPHATRSAIQSRTHVDASDLRAQLQQQGQFVKDFYQDCYENWLQKLGFQNQSQAEWYATVELFRVHCPRARLIPPNESYDESRALIPQHRHRRHRRGLIRR